MSNPPKKIYVGFANGSYADAVALLSPAGLPVDAGVNAIPVSSARPPLTYVEVAGSPFTLSAAWLRVATVAPPTKGVRLSPLSAALLFDIEWCSVPAGSPPPTQTCGEPIFGGESFSEGAPLGDLYLRSASGQTALVKLGS